MGQVADILLLDSNALVAISATTPIQSLLFCG
ncbi:MAG: hypothetical protein ACI96P_002424, partial [Candidatus Azotimanducaceae bacterium]